MKRAISLAVLAAGMLLMCGAVITIVWDHFGGDILDFLFGGSDRGALRYMEKKYGEKFKYVGSGGGLSMPGIKNILVSCESLPGSEILVKIISSGWSETYKDNFMEHYFKKPVEEYVSNIAKNYFDRFTFEVYTRDLMAIRNVYFGMTLEEYITNEYYFIAGYIKIENAEEEIILKFLYELKQFGIHFSLDIPIISTDGKYFAKYHYGYEDIKLEKRR